MQDPTVERKSYSYTMKARDFIELLYPGQWEQISTDETRLSQCMDSLNQSCKSMAYDDSYGYHYPMSLMCWPIKPDTEAEIVVAGFALIEEMPEDLRKFAQAAETAEVPTVHLAEDPGMRTVIFPD